MKRLYFIAIVPPKDLEDRIHQIRIEFAEKFDSVEALKPPVHLTLKEPFTMDVKDELILKRKLSFIATQIEPFNHTLKNFGRFQKHTIYITADKPVSLAKLKSNIKKMFCSEFYQVQQDQMPFNPHYTIAYRDVKEKIFEKAFADYEHKNFYAAFKCNNFILFKHDGKKWNAMEKFTLCGTPEITLFDEIEKKKSVVI